MPCSWFETDATIENVTRVQCLFLIFHWISCQTYSTANLPIHDCARFRFVVCSRNEKWRRNVSWCPLRSRCIRIVWSTHHLEPPTHINFDNPNSWHAITLRWDACKYTWYKPGMPLYNEPVRNGLILACKLNSIDDPISNAIMSQLLKSAQSHVQTRSMAPLMQKYMLEWDKNKFARIAAVTKQTPCNNMLWKNVQDPCRSSCVASHVLWSLPVPVSAFAVLCPSLRAHTASSCPLLFSHASRSAFHPHPHAAETIFRKQTNKS